MKKIAVLSNLRKQGVADEEKKIIAWLKNENIEVLSPQHHYDVVDHSFLHQFLSGMAKDSEAILVLGGDGTLLSVARQAADYGIPILGINMGRVGFLAELDLGSTLYTYLKRLINEDFYIEERMMLKVDVTRDGSCIKTFHCLNDGVILRHNFSGLVKIMVFIDNKLSATYHGDGVAVATPTGASGYSLSANGPLVSPEMQAIVITPICAQSLYSRPIVLGSKRKITVQIAAIEGECYLNIDGKTDTFGLEVGDTVNCMVSPMKTLFIRLNGKTFFDVLNEKLRDRR
ncbi:MAG: NAD(+)/NADH kinase [Clostridiales bacterium]